MKQYSRARELLILGAAALASGLISPSTVRGQMMPPQVTTLAEGYSEEKAVAPVVDVFIPPVGNMRASLVLLQAEGIATDIFWQISVRVRWRAAYTAHAGCSGGPAARTILLAFSWDTPSDFHPRAMAYATPHRVDGTCITVFLDRLKPMIEASPRTAASLLGHVLAHEMGHILQGTDYHSESGVLKAHWSQSEIREIVMHHLSFTEYDRLAILSGLGVTALRVDPNE